jgi:UDP-N-acetylmuramate dehydrogenase
MTPATSLLEELKGLAAKACAAEPLARHSTFAIGGPADFYVEVDTREQLAKVHRWAKDRKLPLFPIGQGSNLLVGDGGIRGVVARLRGDFEDMVFDGDRVAAGAGVMLPQLARECAKRGLSGAEAFVGIPGTVGGGLMTNAGTPEGDLGSLVESVEALNAEGQLVILPRQSLSFSYRRSSLSGYLVTGVVLKLRAGDPRDIMSLVEKQLTRRAERQPLGTFNCGSVFKNPPGDHAARLIEACGLKGRAAGGARISPKHANFIENTGKARAADVRALMDLARGSVKEKFGIDLEPEVWTVGEE